IVWMFFRKFDAIAGWTWPEIVLLYSIGLFTYAIGASFSYVQMRNLENEVREGTFDVILIKPVNSYLYLICRGFNLGYIAHVLISSIMLFWAASQLDIEWTLYNIIYLVSALISGAM